jgi:iron complex outermembrane receptor protein
MFSTDRPKPLEPSRTSLVIAATALSLFTSVTAVAESERSTESAKKKNNYALEEVLVTANKRDGNIRDIAGSVGAVGGEQLEEMKAQGMEDYLKLVPGVTMAQSGADQGVPVIRGIATSNSINGFTALSVGIYLDDMPFQDLFAPQSVPNLNPFDLERVEVLKGPQGTLFGSGALSGAIRYIPRKAIPGEWEGKVQYTSSETNEGSPGKTAAAALNIPLGDSAAIRALGLKREAGGIYDVRVENNVGQVIRDAEDVDNSTQNSYRFLANWDVSERLSLSAMYFEQETIQEDAGSYADNREQPERTSDPFASPRESSFGGLNLGARYAFDHFQVLYSGNALDKKTTGTSSSETALGLGNQNQVEAPNTLNGDVDGTTHEVRFSSAVDSGSPWTWLAGFSRLEYHQFLFQFFTVRNHDGQAPPENPEDVSDADKYSSQIFATIDSYAVENAVFGEVTRTLGERWELTAGLRKYKTQLKSDTLITGAQLIVLTGNLETPTSFDIKSDGLNPKLSIRYLLSDNVQFFALAAKGFQFGGVQLNPPVSLFVTASERSGYTFGAYDSSELWNYEFGVRSEWLDKRLQIDATTFYMDWTDLQLTVSVPVTEETLLTPAVGFGLIANVGAAHAQGAELAINALPWSFLKFTSSVAYLEAQTDVPFDEDHEDGPVPAGTPLPGSARWQISNVLALNFGLPFVDGWDTSFSLTHAFIDETKQLLRSDVKSGDYSTYDFRAILSGNIGRVRPAFSLAVTNLTDERGVSSGGDGGLNSRVAFVQPKTVSLSMDIAF